MLYPREFRNILKSNKKNYISENFDQTTSTSIFYFYFHHKKSLNWHLLLIHFDIGGLCLNLTYCEHVLRLSHHSRIMAAQLPAASWEIKCDEEFCDQQSSDSDNSQNHDVEGAVRPYMYEPEVFLVFLVPGNTWCSQKLGRCQKVSAITTDKAVNLRARTC